MVDSNGAKPRRYMAVIEDDLVGMARILAARQRLSVPAMINDILRPVLEKMMQEHKADPPSTEDRLRVLLKEALAELRRLWVAMPDQEDGDSKTLVSRTTGAEGETTPSLIDLARKWRGQRP